MTRTPASYVQTAIDDAASLLPKLKALVPTAEKIAHLMTAAWERRNKVFFIGNGGSAADAMHFAEELTIRYKRDRRALAAIALTDASAITCCGNDYGYDRIFSRQLEALALPGDVLFGITTSGNSPNIVLALEHARAHGVHTVGFLGKDGGKAKSLCDIALIVPSDSTARIQESHKLIYHAMCDYIDAWALGE